MKYPIGKRRLERQLRGTVFGAQGHSGHETFPNVIRMVAAGRLDLSPIVTARYGLEATVETIAKSYRACGWQDPGQADLGMRCSSVCRSVVGLHGS